MAVLLSAIAPARITLVHRCCKLPMLTPADSCKCLGGYRTCRKAFNRSVILASCRELNAPYSQAGPPAPDAHYRASTLFRQLPWSSRPTDRQTCTSSTVGVGKGMTPVHSMIRMRYGIKSPP
jgi:hypothetical protein